MYKMVNFKNYCGSRDKIIQTMSYEKMLKTIIILSIFIIISYQ